MKRLLITLTRLVLIASVLTAGALTPPPLPPGGLRTYLHKQLEIFVLEHLYLLRLLTLAHM
jgi:hypothetical protein